MPWTHRLALAALVLVRLGGDTVRLLQDPTRFVDAEEQYSPTVGWYLREAGLWDQVLNLQYKTFCGGCTVHALEGAAVTAVFGDSWLAWKALALVWTAVTMLVGFWALDRREGRVAAWCFALLFTFPPPGMSALSLMLWGNHGESGLFVLAALGGGPLQALALGLGVWFGRVTVYALPLGIEAVRQSDRRPLLGFLAAGLALLPAARGDAGDYDLSLAANLLPQGVGAVPTRLAWLVHPSGLAVHMGAPPWAAQAWLVGVGISVVLLLQRRRFVIPGLLLAFLAFWAVSGFDIPRGHLDGPVLQDRYHAPWLLLGTVALAAGSQHLRALLVAGVLPFVFGIRYDSPSFEDRPLVDHGGFAGVAFRRIEPDRLATAHSEDLATDRTLRRLEGYAAAERHAEPPPGESLAAYWQAMTPPGSTGSGVPADPDARRGACWSLRYAMRGDGGDVPCARGLALARDCDTPACLVDALRGAEPDVVWGAGLGCRRGCDGVRNGLDDTLKPAWDAGFEEGETVFPLILARAPAGLR